MMIGVRRVLAVVVLVAGGVLVGAAYEPVFSQAVNYVFRDEESPQVRARLQQQLARDVVVLEQQASALKSMIKLVRPSVVHLEAQKTEGEAQLGRSRVTEEAGSGVIVRQHDRFFVITNRHVVKGAKLTRIEIHLADGRKLYPLSVYADPETDIAVLAIDAPRLIAAEVGDSDVLEIGDYVIAMGSPFGLSHSVTQGIVSALGRRDLELGDADVRFQDFIQTDAAINPGNSGGPLLNLRGQVVGINTAIASSSGGNEGIGFSIPINMVMVVARQLIENGSVQRAFLGVNLDSKFDSDAAEQLGLARKTGARVINVTAGSPAEQANLRAGDVILEFNGIRVDDDGHLVNIVSLTDVGVDVPLVIWRDGKTFRVMVRPGDRSVLEKKPVK